MKPRSAWLAAATLFLTHRAQALGSVGAEVGITQRAVDYTDRLYAGFAFGAHADLDAGPSVKIGPYYLHYETPSNSLHLDLPEGPATYAGGAYNAIGIRGRFVVPVPGKVAPYFHAGIGKTWVSYHVGTPLGTLRRSEDFVELPFGVGASYDASEVLSISFDAAFRPAVLFGGNDDDGYHPWAGTSFLIGASLRL